MSEHARAQLRALKESARSLFLQERYGECAQELERILRLVPKDPNARVQHAETCRRAGNLRAAIASYRTAASLLLAQGCEARARAALRAALELDPRDAELTSDFARLGQAPVPPSTALEDERLYRDVAGLALEKEAPRVESRTRTPPPPPPAFVLRAAEETRVRGPLPSVPSIAPVSVRVPVAPSAPPVPDDDESSVLDLVDEVSIDIDVEPMATPAPTTVMGILLDEVPSADFLAELLALTPIQVPASRSPKSSPPVPETHAPEVSTPRGYELAIVGERLPVPARTAAPAQTMTSFPPRGAVAPRQVEAPRTVPAPVTPSRGSARNTGGAVRAPSTERSQARPMNTGPAARQPGALSATQAAPTPRQPEGHGSTTRAPLTLEPRWTQTGTAPRTAGAPDPSWARAKSPSTASPAQALQATARASPPALSAQDSREPQRVEVSASLWTTGGPVTVNPVTSYRPELRWLSPNAVALRVSPQSRWVIIRSEGPLSLSRAETLATESREDSRPTASDLTVATAAPMR
ncbi:hypothetical protein SAMN05443572_114254 [Myxococcus fulvus]|uniref:Tetratricopeptide repeat protein n=1 Tax=Myxococcus fulvus TaxID=33 RepID=A0ABY1CVL8_MYXFU|nr:hypothetical protein [Myxococcus fulvus]SEU39969.1 hypothetical protein SAMN05443572_114254 [Myxococcus fulvus]